MFWSGGISASGGSGGPGQSTSLTPPLPAFESGSVNIPPQGVGGPFDPPPVPSRGKIYRMGGEKRGKRKKRGKIVKIRRKIEKVEEN